MALQPSVEGVLVLHRPRSPGAVTLVVVLRADTRGLQQALGAVTTAGQPGALPSGERRHGGGGGGGGGHRALRRGSDRLEGSGEVVLRFVGFVSAAGLAGRCEEWKGAGVWRETERVRLDVSDPPPTQCSLILTLSECTECEFCLAQIRWDSTATHGA